MKGWKDESAVYVPEVACSLSGRIASHMDVLRDSLWQFVGAAVAVLALVTSIVVAILQRRRKLLDYEVLTDTPLLTIREELQGRVKVLLDDQPIQDVSVVVIRLLNRGNLPIRASEYERPVVFTFGEVARVISAEVTEQVPLNLSAEIEAETNLIRVKPVLLNGRDSITFKCLVAGAQEPRVDARIVGVSAVRRYDSAESPTRLAVGVIGVLVALAGMYSLVTSAASAQPQPMRSYKPSEIISIVAFNVGMLMTMFSLTPQLRRALKRRLLSERKRRAPRRAA